MAEPYRSLEVATLGPNKKHCYACAGVLDYRAELCPQCGVRQPPLPGVAGHAQVMLAPVVAPAYSQKSKIAAGVLALLLGGIGIHKFYLGQTAAGIMYFLFCWTLIPSLIALVEGLVFLTMSDDTFARRYPA